MDYNDIIKPWQQLPGHITGLRYYILDNGLPRLAESQAAHEGWFKSHQEWIIGIDEVEGSTLRTFFYGIEPVLHPVNAGLPDPLPPLWQCDISFPGDYGVRILTRTTTLEDAQAAHSVALTLLKQIGPVVGDAVYWPLVEAINDDYDKRHQSGKYTARPAAPKTIDMSAPPPKEV